MDLESMIESMGFKIIHKTPRNNNGPDLIATRKGQAFSFEIKKARRLKNNSIQCQPVEPNRMSDDFIAIEFPSGYILIEPMEHHLKNSTSKGFRTFGGLR